MSHSLYVEDESGELVDILDTCSDSCSRELANREDLDYGGWNGCQEVEFTTWCANCGVVIGGLDPECDHVYPVVVNLMGPPVDEYCHHGTLIRAAVRRQEPKLRAREIISQALQDLSEYVGDDVTPFTFTDEDQETIAGIVYDLTTAMEQLDKE